MKDFETNFAQENIVTGQSMIDFINHTVDIHILAMKFFMEKNNEDMPMVFQVITSDLKMIIFPPEIFSISKDVAADFIRFIANKFNAVAVIHVSECWTISKAKNKETILAELEKYGSVSQHPERVECFNIMAFYNIRGKSKCDAYMAPIIRHTDGTRSLDELNATRNVLEDTSGRMTIPAEFLVPIEL